MNVQFREVDPFDVWIWLQFENTPSPMEQQYVEEVFNSWYYLGKLGAFNGENLQIAEMGDDLSYFDYNNAVPESIMMAPMHNMSDFEYYRDWGRCWLDLGTSDPLALDLLINALRQLSKEYVRIENLIVGGQNEDWPIDPEKSSLFADY
ncbi:DUF3531 family protein [Oscillatoria sp. FACHB-1406]|uniref:DUF3531 family protein n=1 Tax=Oscillatoria sp. FACHB-1406 TaxID=2692846 RepID=UPI0016842DDC|nr:DUF3531 family protein [Oscillatoria sp. FACHB-1406]MBD2577115.1 DUF3531 family protein [Oscillatoria sp. FACHB-1406]